MIDLRKRQVEEEKQNPESHMHEAYRSHQIILNDSLIAEQQDRTDQRFVLFHFNQHKLHLKAERRLGFKR